jgi:hypothetical protein
MSSSPATDVELCNDHITSRGNEKSTYLGEEQVDYIASFRDCAADQVVQEGPSEIQSSGMPKTPPASVPGEETSKQQHTDEPWTELATLRSEKLKWLQRMEQLMEENQRYAEESRQTREENELMFAEISRLGEEDKKEEKQPQDGTSHVSTAVADILGLLEGQEFGEGILQDKVKELCGMVKGILEEKHTWAKKMQGMMDEHTEMRRQNRCVVCKIFF